MNNERTMRQILLVSGLVALLLMAFLFDFATTALQIRNSQGAGLEPVLLVLFPVFELVIVLGGMGLLWYLFSSPGAGITMPIVYLVIGLLILFATPLLFFLPVPAALYGLVQYVRPGTYFFQAGAMIGVIGILSLWLKKDQPDVVEKVEAT